MDIAEPNSIAQFTVYGALVAAQAYMIKYFIEELRRKDGDHKDAIKALVADFKESLKEVATESKEALSEIKDSFNNLAKAIDDMRDRIDKG